MGRLRILAHDLQGEPLTLPFALAVFAQLTRVPGAYADAPPVKLDALSHQLSAILRAAASGDDSMGDALAADPPLAAAFFQNVDLLYDSGFAHADVVSAMIMHALQLLEASAK